MSNSRNLRLITSQIIEMMQSGTLDPKQAAIAIRLVRVIESAVQGGSQHDVFSAVDRLARMFVLIRTETDTDEAGESGSY